MPVWLSLSLQVLVLAYAALGGVFLPFSDFLMRALGSVEGGLEAMQAINREVFRIVFMALFMGLTPISLVLLGAAVIVESVPLSAGIAGALYVVGCFVLTAAGNVPLNDRLARLDAASAEGADYWRRTYLPRWTTLNTIRCLACFAAAATLLNGLIP